MLAFSHSNCLSLDIPILNFEVFCSGRYSLIVLWDKDILYQPHAHLQTFSNLADKLTTDYVVTGYCLIDSICSVQARPSQELTAASIYRRPKQSHTSGQTCTEMPASRYNIPLNLMTNLYSLYPVIQPLSSFPGPAQRFFPSPPDPAPRPAPSGLASATHEFWEIKASICFYCKVHALLFSHTPSRSWQLRRPFGNDILLIRVLF